MDDACDSLLTDSSCTHGCNAGYNDNNDGFGQQYSCDGGNFVGTALVCKKAETCAKKKCHATPALHSFQRSLDLILIRELYLFGMMSPQHQVPPMIAQPTTSRQAQGIQQTAMS